jgi:integrase
VSKRHNPFPGVTSITDRHGRRRYRFRLKGKPQCYILGEYGSAEFRAAYEAAMQKTPAIINPPKLPDRGTFAWLIQHYILTPDFQKIGKIYKRNLFLEMERFRRDYGHCVVADLRADHVEQIIARKAATPAAANKLLKLMRRLCRFAIRRQWLAVDPTVGLKPYVTNPDGYYTWTEADISRFEEHHGVGSKAVLAMRLMLYTGAARQDAARMGWQNIKGERIEYRRGKTGGDVSLGLHLMPDLCEVLGLAPRDRLLFVSFGLQGRGYNAETYGNWFKDQVIAAGLPANANSHGLRKAGATRLANAGATEFEIMAFLGHKTPNEARTYVKAANRLTLADGALQKRMNVSNPVVRLDNSSSNQLK